MPRCRRAVVLNDEELRELEGMLARRVAAEYLHAEQRGTGKIWVHQCRAEVGRAHIQYGIATNSDKTRVKVAHLTIVLLVGIEVEDWATVASVLRGLGLVLMRQSVSSGIMLQQPLDADKTLRPRTDALLLFSQSRMGRHLLMSRYEQWAAHGARTWCGAPIFSNATVSRSRRPASLPLLCHRSICARSHQRRASCASCRHCTYP